MDTFEDIAQRVRALLEELPPHVLLVAAVKTRSAEDARAAAAAGVTALGHNYVQEAETMRDALARPADEQTRDLQWRLIGHLQRNKAKRAVQLFDVIETVDSLRLARALDRHCAEAGKVMPVLIEVNSAGEANKSGVAPEEGEDLARATAELPHLRLRGLMTMGPASGDPEEARPCFRRTKELFDRLADLGLPDVEMRELSMGMSDSYRAAIEEGANVVRIGSRLFGPRGSAVAHDRH